MGAQPHLMTNPDTPTMSFPLSSEAETAALAATLMAALRAGDVVLLHGDLGAGKTAFVRGAIRSVLGAATEVPSPTFTLVQVYDAPAAPIWHFDLFRIGSADEVIELDWEDAVADGIVFVEWPDRLGLLCPRRRIDLMLAPGSDGDSRIATLTPRGDWGDRLSRLVHASEG